jgi:hypothetical protein
VPPGLEDRCPEGCVYSPDTGINASPRIGTVAIVSPEDLAPCQDCEVTIRNIVGLFIDRHVVTVGPGTEQEISGRIVRVPGRLEPSATAVHQTASALRQIVLVR